MNLYLTRHGQTVWNVEKRMQGKNNSLLTELGVQQAIQFGKYMKNVQLSCIYSSSSLRALHTAELICGERNIPIIASNELMEIGLGEWEGMTFCEVEKQYPEQFYNFWNQPEKYNRPDGESFEVLRQRVSTKIEEIAQLHSNETVWVVAHGMALKTLYTYFQKQSIHDIAYSPRIESACVCMVEKHAGVWNVMRWNEVITEISN
ncbi:MAG: histidine phosphatase family protein [Bacteroidales bacterium]|jgi:probable phosphoglycerate mutase|nr:histidine phosphatase family protein [Bacteroidales bacterium]